MVLELTLQGEALIDEGKLLKVLTQDLGYPENVDIFIPSIIYDKGERHVALHLMEGYVFISSGLEDREYFQLERFSYIENVLSFVNTSGIRTLKTLPDSEVILLKEKLRSISVTDVSYGDIVEITDGDYKGLQGRIIDKEGVDAYVNICLRSLEVIVEIPTAFISVTPALECEVINDITLG